MFKDQLLAGRRILVTGGGTGLGKAMAARFLELGAEVHICGRRKIVCDETATELMDLHGGRVTSHGVDIRNALAVDEMIETIFREGPLTDLINNAAGNFISRSEELSPRGFDAVANIVMHGTFYVTHAVGRRWIAAKLRGNVVSITVTWVRIGSPYVVPSAMSKSAIHAMTMSLATEWGHYGIRLNTIAPGEIPTEGMSKVVKAAKYTNYAKTAPILIGALDLALARLRANLAIVDVIATCEDSFLAERGFAKGSMRLLTTREADGLYAAMGPAREISGGSAANSMAVPALGSGATSGESPAAKKRLAAPVHVLQPEGLPSVSVPRIVAWIV